MNRNRVVLTATALLCVIELGCTTRPNRVQAPSSNEAQGNNSVQRAAETACDASIGGADAIRMTRKTARCDYELRDAVGTNYRSLRPGATPWQDQLKQRLDRCMQSEAELRGVVYISGKIKPNGAVQRWEVSPSGAVVQSTTDCLRQGLAGMVFPAPSSGCDHLMLALVANCKA